MIFAILTKQSSIKDFSQLGKAVLSVRNNSEISPR